MAKFNADKIYFDELAAGIGAGVNFDASKNFDMDSATQIVGTVTVDLGQQVLRFVEIIDIEAEGFLEVIEDYSQYIDLMQLIPTKFRGSTLLQEYLDEVGLLVGTWLGDINDLTSLIDKYAVGDTYIQKLADLVNLTILSDDTTSILEKRRQLIQVIEWYKMKGTYKALQYVGYLIGMELNLWDLYTDNYSTFTREAWYTGALGTNPGGLGSSYYKSPHLGIEILLNKVYGSGITSYLFRSDMLTNLSAYVEKARPINVVPHYTILLSPITDQTGNVTTVAGNIQTCIIGTWSFSRLYFDAQSLSDVVTDTADTVVTETSDQVIAESAASVKFDDSKLFDLTQDAFYNSITRWKLGTGNKGVSPAQFGWSMQTVVLSGTISGTRVYPSYIEYEFEVPNTTTQAGISELGLFLSNGTTLEIGCTFPNIDLAPGVGLRVLLRLNRL